MSALRWKRRSSPPSTARTASSSSVSLAAHVVSISSATTPSTSASDVSVTSVVMTAPAIVPTAGAHVTVEPQSQRAKLKLAIDTQLVPSTPASTAARSPGCFPICGWTTCATATTNSGSVLTSPIGSPSHCYLVDRASSRSVKQLTSPVRSGFHFLPTLRKPVVCSQCQAALSTDIAERKRIDRTVPSPQSPTASSSAARCIVCCKASAFETQLAKSFFSPGLVDGKSVGYPGLPIECYRQWFRERPMTPNVVLETEARRAKMLTKLQQQHKLHYPKLKDVCSEVCAAFAVATCYVSVADAHLELIVGNYGSMLHFSCVPREVGMCDYTMGAPEQQLLVRCVEDDAVFRDNPLLQTVNAQFYLGVPIIARGVAIGAIAVLDASARREPLDTAALAFMTQKAEIMGSRVTALLPSSSRSGLSMRVMKRRPR